MFDIIIKNTNIVDGSGDPAYLGDIAINGSKIVEIGDIKDSAEIIIDGTNLTTCPGFIDPHSHPDMTFSILPLCYNFVMQGITTAIGGNCGLSQAPIKAVPAEHKEGSISFEGLQPTGSKKDISFGQWLKKVERRGISINYVPRVGHNSIRSAVMGDDYKRLATPEEIEAMKEFVDEGMKSGAFGFSTGLDYDPSEYCNTEEVIELAKVAKKHGGIFTSHIRHCASQWATNDPDLYGPGVFHGEIEESWVGKYQGLMEAFKVGKKANIPVQISHFHTMYLVQQPHPEFLDEATAKASLWLIDNANKEGIDVTFDIIVSDTSVYRRTPIVNAFILSGQQKLQWLREFNKQEFVEKLKNQVFRGKIKKLQRDGYLNIGSNTKSDPYWMNRFKILTCKNGNYEEKIIGDLAIQLNKEPLDLIFDIIIEDPDVEWLHFDDDRAVNYNTLPIYLNHPHCMPCTDVAVLPTLDFPIENLKKIGTDIPEEFLNYVYIPHAYGMYANYIGRFVRDTGALTLENAIRKATSFVAERFGIKERGALKPNYYADILVFDYEKIKMTGDIMNSRQAPDGIEYVLINGKISYRDKQHTGIKAGEVLKHNSDFK